MKGATGWGTALYVLLVLGAGLVALKAHYTTDLSAFLPTHPSTTQRVLIGQLREGPAARVIIAAISGGDPAARARISAQLAQALRASALFAAVSNGDDATLERDRDFLFRYRYVLSPTVSRQRFSVTGLHAALQDSLAALASPEGLLFKPVFAQDPTGELLTIVENLAPVRAPRTAGGVWSSRDGRSALLLLQTRAAGADTDAQQHAAESVRRAFEEARTHLPASAGAAMTLALSGPPVFAVASRALIKAEVLRLSGISAALITLLLLAVYRSLPALLLGFVPVASGALAGIAAVALGFGAVHGITLGFGVTLIGEAVDYSIYLFIQGRQDARSDWRHGVWPTIRLGMLTSITGFAALLPSHFQGLAQLGLYSIAGLIAAALVTRYVLPAWLPVRLATADLSAPGAALQRAVARLRRARALLLLVPLLAAGVLYAHRGAVLSHELAALSPVPVAQQDLDERLRADLGAPDVRYMVVAPALTREAALEAAQRLSARLDPLVDDGVIAGFESASRYLPSATEQRERQQALPPAAELKARLAAAASDLPVRLETLEPFLQAIAQARAAPLLRRADLAGTSFAALTDTLLMATDEGYAALLPVTGRSGDLSDADVAAVRAAVQASGTQALLLDLRGETERLYADYLRQGIELSLAGCAAIALLLLIALRSAARLTRVLLPLALAVLSVAAILVAAGERLTILHLVGMLLIVAAGSNYGLFFDRATHAQQHGSPALIMTSLLVANLATVLAFGVLAFSRVPVLADLGTTVAPGALFALLFSAMLSGPALQTAR